MIGDLQKMRDTLESAMGDINKAGTSSSPAVVIGAVMVATKALSLVTERIDEMEARLLALESKRD